MLNLKPGEVCSYAGHCPYSDSCQGTQSTRKTSFTCDFVSDTGTIKEGMFRNKLDQTGKMQVIMERV